MSHSVFDQNQFFSLLERVVIFSRLLLPSVICRCWLDVVKAINCSILHRVVWEIRPYYDDSGQLAVLNKNVYADYVNLFFTYSCMVFIYWLMMNWLVVWQVDWLSEKLILWLAWAWLIDWLIDWLCDRVTRCPSVTSLVAWQSTVAER